MARFDRPAGTIESHADLKQGDQVWHVLGIWRPQILGPNTVVRASAPFKEHPKYEEHHFSHAEYFVFDVRWPDSNFVDMNYASDGNLIPGHSHNDNYWCRTQEEAEAARDYLTAQWEANPEMIADEVARREENCRFYDSLMDCDPYPADEDAA